VRSLSQERNCTRLMHPCLTIREYKVPGKDDRRVDDFQKPLRTEIGGKSTISSRRGGVEKRKRGKDNGGKYVHGITVGE